MAAAGLRNPNAKASIADIATKVEIDQQESVRKLGQAHHELAKMLHTIFSQDLQLYKKSASWLPKLSDKEMKERVRTCEAFVTIIGSLTILNNILTVGELARGEEQTGRPHPHPGGLHIVEKKYKMA